MSAIEQLLEIMRRLRDPQAGCPWDMEQTYRTLVPYTLEEAYEVADAIEQDDLEHLPDELGDLLVAAENLLENRLVKGEDFGVFQCGDRCTGGFPGKERMLAEEAVLADGIHNPFRARGILDAYLHLAGLNDVEGDARLVLLDDDLTLGEDHWA